MESINDSTPWLSCSLRETSVRAANSLRISRILHPGCHVPYVKRCSCGHSVERIQNSTPWFSCSLRKTPVLAANPSRVSRILHPGCEMCCNLPIRLKIPPFPRITEILGFAGLCNTFKDSDGHPWAPRVPTCVVIYHSNSTSRPSCVLRKSLLLWACAALSRT